jgi:CHASE3 domain sensor protein
VSFSERFDEWRIDRSLDPLDDATAARLDQAAAATSEFMREHKDEIVAEITQMLSELIDGENVDLDQRVDALLDRLEGEES